MKSNLACLLALSALVLLGQGRDAHAQTTYILTDTTIDYYIPGHVFIGRDDNGHFGSPTVNLVRGGDISNYAVLYDGVFNMSGGSIDSGGGRSNFGLVAIGGTVNLSGGFMDYLTSQEDSTVNITGGSFGFLKAQNDSTVTIRGGRPDFLAAEDNSTLNLFGNNLQATLTGQIGGTKSYSLSGTLADGTDLAAADVDMSISGSASFTLNTVPNAQVPEPGSLALLCGLGVVGAGLLRRKRRR